MHGHQEREDEAVRNYPRPQSCRRACPATCGACTESHLSALCLLQLLQAMEKRQRACTAAKVAGIQDLVGPLHVLNRCSEAHELLL